MTDDMRLSKEQLRSRMERVLEPVATNGFYRRKYGLGNMDVPDSIEYILNNFYNLPLLTRGELQDLNQECLSDRVDSKIYFTGGTSGIPGMVEWKNDDLRRCTVPLSDIQESFKVLDGACVLSTVGTATSIYGIMIDMACATTRCTLLQCNDAGAYNYEMIQRINEIRPVEVIYGTPMGVLGMARNERLRNALRCVKVAFVGGAPMTDDTRYIAEAFGCEIVDLLGSTETILIGYKGSDDEGFDVIGENVMLEIDGGSEGATIVTSLQNTHMPIVRYLTDDVGEMIGGRYKLLRRVTETFYIGGTKVSLNLFDEILRSLGLDSRYQLVVGHEKDVTTLLMNIVAESTEVDGDIVKTIMMDENLALFNKVERGVVRLEIRFIDQDGIVGLTSRGKYKKVIES